MLEQGVAKEVARAVLPLSRTRSTTGAEPTLADALLRPAQPPNAQYEIQQYAAAAESFLERLMPITHAAFVANNRTAP